VHDPAVTLLAELVKRPSVTPQDAGCQALIARRLESAGFTCEHLPFGDVSNLWARFGTDRPLLCFAGHTDVVPPGSLDQWHTPPFEAVIRDGFLYGRGAADMKAGLAAMVVAAERFTAANPAFPGSLGFLITSDEEGPATNGTRKVLQTLTERGEQIDWCVIGEPSSESALGDILRIGRRGSLNGRLRVKGQQGHVAYPALANNPIQRFAPALAEMCETVWDHGNDHFPPTSLQVVEIASGVGAINVTPAELRASLNFRYSTEWKHSGLQDALSGLLDRHGLDYEIDWELSGEPFLTSPGKLIDAATQAVIQECDLRPGLSTSGGTSDGRFISPAGAEVIELGPVNASIHKVNERVRISDVPRLASLYQRIVELLLL